MSRSSGAKEDWKTVVYDTSDVIDPDTIMMVFNEGIFAKTLLQGRGICKP
jgi:hypothetical protein